MVRTILQAVKPHDQYQLEIKLDYELLQGERTRYRVRTYFFVPQNLGINQDTYDDERFYRDVQNYLRLKTPSLVLRDFTTSPSSPLVKIRQIVSRENWMADPGAGDLLINNIKVMGAMWKSALRDHVELIQRRIAEAPPSSDIGLQIDNLIDDLLVESRKIREAYRRFYAAVNLPHVDDQIFVAYQFTDEWISLQLEESAVELYQIADSYLKEERKDRIQRELQELVESEYEHRRSHGYDSILRPDDDNESYIYRLSVLKKFTSSVLFLNTDMNAEGETLEHVLFALAAGVSMIFATMVAFYAQQQFGELTFPLFIALVVGYMFKDRIKELGRDVFASLLRNHLYDRRITLQTREGGHRLGFLREKVDFVSEEEIPQEVLNLRDRDHITDVNNDGQGETVFCYSKEVVLFTNTFKQAFAQMPPISGINDIMRYDIRNYLRKMDEPFQKRQLLANHNLVSAICHKVYHLNLISVYELVEPKTDLLYRRTRLVLDRKGIKRIEHGRENQRVAGDRRLDNSDWGAPA